MTDDTADRPGRSWLALDVGGANIKAAHSAGEARTLPFELWKRPEELPRVLETLAGTFPAFDALAVTMTAELCDCYATKAEGVADVLGATLNLAPQAAIRVWGTDGRFHAVADVLAQPLIAAAANWLALAHVAARRAEPGPALLIDIGTTTSDLIPLRDRAPVPRGRIDTERLSTGELVYAGVRRTPVCALATELDWQGGPIGLAAELFATTLDLYLILGDWAEDPTDTLTADGRAATVEAAHMRLARMVGADGREYPPEAIRALARAADAALRSRLLAAARRACAAIGRPRSAIIAGSGSFLARRVAAEAVEPGGPIIALEDAWGPVASAAACAHALLVLAREADGP
jgi:probable H4MPT-linked C1 transfer pathway protein